MAYLQTTRAIANNHREAAKAVYSKYRAPFLEKVAGATSKQLLVRNEDVQVLHEFESEKYAKAYMESSLFQNDVVRELDPLLCADPDVRIYSEI